MEDIHKDILQSNHIYICKNLNLQTSEVLDKLQEDLVISSDEADEIINFGPPREQASHLLYFLKKKDASKRPFYALLKALQPSHDFITKTLSKDLDETRDKTQRSTMCIYCFMLINLMPQQISHEFYQSGLLSDDELEEINNPKRTRRRRVQVLFKHLSKCTNYEKVSKIFREFIEKNFNCVYQPLKIIGQFLKCTCKILKNEQKRKIKASEVRKAKKFKPFEIKPKPFTKQVAKAMLNETRLMRKLTDLWNDSWFLREEGKWDELEIWTAAAVSKYGENPDIYVFLLHTEMCTAAFYLDDEEKAKSKFQEAKALLPKASLSSWHLGRFFSLQIHMCLKAGQLAKAQTLINQGHQELDLLGPSIATGTLYFSEGLYYSELLRRHCKGTKAQQILERAKNCFLKAAEYYREEPFFAISSWRDQVNLFVAFMEMHVDFKKLINIDVQMHNKDGFKLVEYYLDHFENECWGRATKWSKMMFNIARGKQHESKGSYSRCIEYYHQAKVLAENGKFEFYMWAMEELLEKCMDRIHPDHNIMGTRIDLSDSSSRISDDSDEDTTNI